MASDRPETLLEDPTSLPLGEILGRVARLIPDRPSLLGATRTWTWAELDEEVDRVADLLERLGVLPGDMVGMIASKRPEVVTVFLACARMGAIFCPVNFKLHSSRVQDQFATAGIRCVFAEAEHDELIEVLSPLLPDHRKIVYLDAPGIHGTSRYDQIHEGPRPSPGYQATPDTVCYLNYTSGTTGRPKGAVTTHRNIVVNALSGIEGLGFRGDDVYMGMFSVFSHPHELFHRSLLVGGPFVVVDTLSPRITCQLIERFHVSWMMAVPSFYEMMLDQGGPGRYDISSLRVLEAGGAYVPPQTILEMEASFKAWFMPVWGSTETTGVALANPPGSDRQPGATGRPVPFYEVRVVNDEGQEVPIGGVGEMRVRSDAVAHGYHNRPEEEISCFRDGWYHTGDMVKRGENGFIHFIGRRSEMLKIGGIRVYPLELEQVILSHPEVREVVVVRHEERLRGEIARAVVATVPGSTLDGKALRNWCRDRLAVYQVPRIIEFWRDLPKLPNGKLDKAAVRAVPVDPARDERS